MTSHRVFISHSNRDPEAGVLLETLKAYLVAANFEPIVSDEQTRLGKNWELELQRDLGRCDGAVVIISTHALKVGSWVYRESNILMHRRSNNPRFTVIPVLCEVSRRKLAASTFDQQLKLSRLNMPKRALADPASAVVAQLRANLPPERPLQLLEAKIRQELRFVDEELLDEMAKMLKENLQGQTKQQKITAVAERLFATDMRSFVAALEPICDLGNAGDASRVIELSFPFSWIESTAVDPLRRRSSASSSYALNSAHRLTARMYVRCASTRPEMYVSDAVAKSREEVVPATLREVQIAISDAFAYSPEELPEPAELRTKIADRAARGTPVVILLRPPVESEVLVALAEHYPELISLIMVGDTAPESLPPDVMVLQPQLNPNDEKCAHAEYKLMMRNAGYEVLEDGTKRRNPA